MNIYHVLNRGVDKRTIFLDDQDRFRFIHDMYEFNNQDRVNTTFYIFKKNNDIGCRKIETIKRKLLVNIYAFCLMSNHYHILLSPRIDGGIPRFMKKLNMGYAKYFNEKYKRTGALFQGKYKSIIVKNETHFLYLPFYIHMNPLDLIFPEWRKGSVSNSSKAMKYLESYRWSSFMDYIGKRNFPSVTYRDFLSDFMKKQNFVELLGDIDQMDRVMPKDFYLE